MTLYSGDSLSTLELIGGTSSWWNLRAAHNCVGLKYSSRREQYNLTNLAIFTVPWKLFPFVLTNANLFPPPGKDKIRRVFCCRNYKLFILSLIHNAGEKKYWQSQILFEIKKYESKFVCSFVGRLGWHVWRQQTVAVASFASFLILHNVFHRCCTGQSFPNPEFAIWHLFYHGQRKIRICFSSNIANIAVVCKMRWCDQSNVTDIAHLRGDLD